jgi:small-conductance mechanosensitive channel
VFLELARPVVRSCHCHGTAVARSSPFFCWQEIGVTQVAEWLNQHNVNLVTVAGTVAILIAASLAIFLINRLLRQWLTFLQGRLNLAVQTNLVIGRIIVAFLWAVTLFIVLNVWGIGLGGLWAVLISAITVVGVGFLATWAMISNFTASFFLVLWRPFRIGQTVEVLPENLKGRVTGRNLMFTTLREESGALLQVPNNFFFQKIFRVSGGRVASTVELRGQDQVAPMAPELGNVK